MDPQAPAFDGKRMRGVLELVRRQVGLGQGRTLPKGTAMGVAFHFCSSRLFRRSRPGDGGEGRHVKVDKVWVVGDIGSQIINPSNAENQVQGAVLDGIAEALGQEITIEKGRTVQTNFNNFPLLRMRQAPPIEVHFKVTEFAPTGLGRAGAAAGRSGAVQRDLRWRRESGCGRCRCRRRI